MRPALPPDGSSPDTHGQASATFARLTASEPIAAHELIADLIETLAPRFQGLTRLGQGGMGIVYTARDPLLKRDVAVKVLAPEFREDVGARERFVREAQAAAAVAHPNVVNIFQVGELTATKIPYFVMQFIEGATLEQAYPRGNAAPEAATRRIVGEVAAALAAAHGRGLVHRDIKPSNIMLDPHTGRAIVLDFGISASVQQPPRDERLTATGMYIGTPRYMSPEQASGETATEKSDIYSLGCVAYELIAGRPVFEGKSAMDLMASHLRDQPQPLSEVRPGIDREFASVVMRCLAKDPASRPTASEVHRRLTPGGEALLEWPPPGLETLTGRAVRVARILWLGDAVLLAALLPFILAGPRMPSVADSTGVVLLLLCGVVAIAILATGAVKVVRTARRAVAAVRNGFSWLTVTETLADDAGDSGLLITGARQYAALTAEQRAALRRGRLVRAAALTIGAIVLLPALHLMFAAGAVLNADFRLALAAAIPSLLCLLVARGSAQRERALVQPTFADKAAAAAPPELEAAPGWTEALAVAASGQQVAYDAEGRSRSGVVIAALSCLLVAIGLFALVPVLTVTAAGSVLIEVAMPKFGSTNEKARMAELARAFVLAPDATLSATDAGTMFYAMQGPRRSNGIDMLPVPPRPARPWTDAPLPAGNFGTAKPLGWAGPASTKILARVQGGFSPEELRYLQMVASAPVWADWDRVARARAIDVLGTSLAMPVSEGVTVEAIPIPKFASLKELAYASVSRAAYHLTRNQRDSAEHSLRATISVGLVMSDNAVTLIERLIGVVIVGIGRDALIQLYDITGNPAGRRLQARVDSALRAREAREDADMTLMETPIGQITAPAARRRALTLAGSPQIHRSLRLEMLMVLGWTPCTNLRELIFGADEEVREVFARARRELVRFPSDSLLVALSEVGPLRHANAPAKTLFERMSKVAGAVTANPRLAGCMRLMVF